MNIQPPYITQFFGMWKGDTDWKVRLRPDTPLTKFNRLIIAFGTIEIKSNGDFTVGLTGPKKRLIELVSRVKAVNPTAQIFLSISGDGTSTSFGGACSNAAFPKNVLKYLARYGLDGVDIDWELGYTTQTLNSLMAGLADALHPPKEPYHPDVPPKKYYQISMDGGSYASPLYDFNTLNQYVDWINIMSYYASQNLETCANTYKGFPFNKLLGGIDCEFNAAGGHDTRGPKGSIQTKSNVSFVMGLAGMFEWRLDNDFDTIPKRPNYPTYKGAKQLWYSMTHQDVFKRAIRILSIYASIKLK